MAFILLIAYFAVSSGVVVNFHYCMNRLASTELFATESKQCGKCGMDLHKGKGCCHDEVKVIKMKDDQKVTASLTYDLSAPIVAVFVPSEFITSPFTNTLTGSDQQNRPPPLLARQDIYLQHCVFRI